MIEPTADVSVQRVFEAELHLTTSDYRAGLERLPTLNAIRLAIVIVGLAATVLVLIELESTETRSEIPMWWLAVIVPCFAMGFYPDLLAWLMYRTSPFREGAMVRLDAEGIVYTGRQATLSYGWPLVGKAFETRSAFRLVAGVGVSAAICVLPKQMFPHEDHAAIRDLITTKVGRLRRPWGTTAVPQ
ncbi:hypothetical protein AB1046_14480 [Promicromonospora sp. Populi]|uniref:hypothetical protein n=1 Tax=Promicromonospora sp. Populi TaxID=3239420 RepID=UPI0034E2E3C6